jgi:hypothetical protein
MTVPNFNVNRHARNEIEFHRLLTDATSGEAEPAAGSTYADGVAAAIRWMSGGKHPFVQPAPDPAAALPQNAPAAAPAAQPPAPNRGPTGAGAAPTGAGGGGTGTTGTGGGVNAGAGGTAGTAGAST